MSDVDVDQETLASLAGKIEGLDLTAAEHAVLRDILDRAEAYEPEVEGFGMSRTRYRGAASGSELGRGAFTLGLSAGMIKMPGTRRMDDDPTGGSGGWPPGGMGE